MTFFIIQTQFNQLSNMENINRPLNDYTIISVIGKGSFAKVMLARHKTTENLCALKSMKKKYIEKKNQVKQIMMERDILTQLNSPFLIKIHSAFQTETKLYLSLEYCPGGQLFGLLLKKKRLTETMARFYGAQLLLALEYLHAKNIVYRDLKPENVLIGADGYIKLTDFGLSKSNIQGNYEEFSVCGTPQYLAPEVIKKVGHGKAVDWWCLGTIIYQLIHGMPPFYTKNRNLLYDKILNTEPEMNKNWSKNLRDLFSKLLQKDPEERLKDATLIKQHPWFSLLQWDDLNAKKLKPPFVPILNDENDVSNFSNEFTKCSLESKADSIGDFANYEGFSYEMAFSPSEKDQEPFKQVKCKLQTMLKQQA